MAISTHISDITHVIQASIAPVFLLTALSGTLGVLTTRLGRVVDRARVLRERHPGDARPSRDEELAVLVLSRVLATRVSARRRRKAAAARHNPAPAR